MLYSQSIIIFIAVCILLIVIEEVRKKRAKGIVIATCLRDFNRDFVFSTIWFILALSSFWAFSRYYFDNYSFFIPKYLSKWYYMFSYEHLVEIESQLLKDKDNMWYELCRVAIFKSGFKSLYLGMAWIMISGMYFYHGIQKSEIYTDGVWLRRYKYKWNKIKEYEWKANLKKQSKKEYSKYYKLALYTTNERFDKRLLKVKSMDKEKVDNLLKEKNISMKS